MEEAVAERGDRSGGDRLHHRHPPPFRRGQEGARFPRPKGSGQYYSLKKYRPAASVRAIVSWAVSRPALPAWSPAPG